MATLDTHTSLNLHTTIDLPPSADQNNNKKTTAETGMLMHMLFCFIFNATLPIQFEIHL